MGETLSLGQPSFNRSVRVESRPERVSSDAGFLLGADALHASGIIDALSERLHDPRRQDRVEYDLATLLRSFVLMVVQGWGDQSDVERLRRDPLLAIASSQARGQAAAGQALASQPTFARFLDLLARPANQSAINTAAMTLAGQRLRATNGGQRLRRLTINVDGLPLVARGEQPGSAPNCHVGERVQYPLVGSCAETGDLLGALLRVGNTGRTEGVADLGSELIAQARAELADEV